MYVHTSLNKRCWKTSEICWGVACRDIVAIRDLCKEKAWWLVEEWWVGGFTGHRWTQGAICAFESLWLRKKYPMISRGFIANRIWLDSHEERYWTHLKLYNLAQATLAPSSGRSLPSSKWFLHVSAGAGHKVLLWSDGNPVACGMNSRGQGTIPPLDDGMLYTQVSAATVTQYFFEAMGMLCFVES